MTRSQLLEIAQKFILTVTLEKKCETKDKRNSREGSQRHQERKREKRCPILCK